MKLAEKALEVAITQIGKEETPHGSNWGEPVRSYLLSVGINFPASWCMAFVYWCFKKASEAIPMLNPAIKSAGCLDVYNRAKVRKITSDTPKSGAVFIMDFGQGHGHTGLVERFDETYIYTIEGNTNDSGSREGYEVCRRKRLRTSIKGYVIY